MKLSAIMCAAAAVVLAGAAAAEDSRTPAEWAAQLGAERLADREAASAALLGLGPKARDDVRRALDSTDPEVQSRAKELWKTLRWLVIPGADEDTANLVAEADKGGIDAAHWKDFVQKHGAESIRLAAEFKVAAPAAPQANPAPADPGDVQGAIPIMAHFVQPPQMNANYGPGLIAVLDNVPPMDVARLVAETDDAHGRATLYALLEEVPPAGVDEKTAVRWMQIEIALWNYRKAYDFGRDFSCLNGSPGVVQQCAIAVDRGRLFDKIPEAAGRKIAVETDPWWLCAKLSFYTGLFATLEKKPLIDPLFDLPKNTSVAKASDSALRRLVESLLTAGMPARAVKVLHNVQSPQALYMRSAADLQIQDEPVAGTDFREALLAADAVGDDKKKEVFYNLAELMNDWHDDRAGMLWQKILSMPPATTVYDANACFRLGEALEARRDYANAADIYEEGMNIATNMHSVFVVVATRQDGSGASAGLDTVRQKIKNLRLLAAGQKSLFQDSPNPNPPPPSPGNQ